MGAKYALLIAVEHYHEVAWSTVQYASADARALADALVPLGFDTDNQFVLIDAEATKARLDSKLRRVVEILAEDDELLVYFAGHGTSEANRNYLICHDSERHDVIRTSMPLQEVFDFLRGSRCRKVQVLLDCCHSGPHIRDEDRGILDSLDDNEIMEFFGESEYFVCFASCKDDQKSHSSRELKHGIWTFHILQALAGNADDAIERSGLVTSSSLQAYLSRQVPLSVRQVIAGLVAQTPVLYGSMTREFVVADLTEVLAARRLDAEARQPVLERLVFRSEQVLRVKSLSGFRSGHRVPDNISEATTRFLYSISEAELKKEAERYFGILKTQLKYPRRELKITSGGGATTLFTPDFELVIYISLVPEDPAQAVMCIEVVNISRPDVVNSPEFNAAFDGVFSTVEFEYSEPFSLEDLVDALEDGRDHELAVDYPTDLSTVSIRDPNWPFRIVVTDACLRIEFEGGHSPAELLGHLEATSQMFLTQHTIRLLTGQ